MRLETPAARRSSVLDLGNRVVVTIPMRVSWFARLFLPVWLCGWAAGEVSVGKQLLSGRAPAFLVLWLAVWTVGGVFALAALVSLWAGREKLELSEDSFERWFEPLPFPLRRAWALSSMRRLRVVTPEALSRSNALQWYTGGPLAFDYGAKTVRLAAGLDEAEAQDLLNELSPRFPALARARQAE